MKKLLSIILLSSFLNGISQQIYTENKAVTTSSANTKNDIKLNQTTTNLQVLEEDIKINMEYLASDALEGRNTGSKGIEKAAVFIENLFQNHNIKPYFETYRDSFNIKKIVGYNLVGYIEGNDPKLKNQFVFI